MILEGAIMEVWGLQLLQNNYDPNSNFPPKLKWPFLKY